MAVIISKPAINHSRYLSSNPRKKKRLQRTTSVWPIQQICPLRTPSQICWVDICIIYIYIYPNAFAYYSFKTKLHPLVVTKNCMAVIRNVPFVET